MHFTRQLVKASTMLAFSFITATASSVQANPEIVDSKSLAQQAQEKSERIAKEDQQRATSQLFYQLQLLQDEIMRLRGQLEEQDHHIRQLKQQRLDDYVSFDKRIADLQNQLANAQTQIAQQPSEETSETGSTAGAVTTAALVKSSGDEQADYKAAFEMVRQKQSEQAIVAFESFISTYPNSTLLPNCYFWLGRLQAQKKDYSNAEQSFAKIINEYTEDKRVPEAKFHRAKAQFELGDKAIAKTELENLVARYSHSTDSSLQRTVRQAREFLNTYYP